MSSNETINKIAQTQKVCIFCGKPFGNSENRFLVSGANELNMWEPVGMRHGNEACKTKARAYILKRFKYFR